jgi:hypothetical protein
MSNLTTINFYKPDNIFGQIVSWATRSPICHTGVGHTLYGCPVVTQALGGSGTTLQRPDDKRLPCVAYPVPWIPDDLAVACLYGYWGVPYGWKNIMSFEVKGLYDERAKYHGMICSELVAEFLKTAYDRMTQEKWTNVPHEWQMVDHQLRTVHEGNTSLISPAELNQILNRYIKPIS